MVMHTIAFSLYLLSLIIDSIFFINYMLIKKSQEAYKNFITVQAFGDVFNFLSQLILFKILYDLGKPMPKRAKSSSDRNSMRPLSSHHSGTLTNFTV